MAGRDVKSGPEIRDSAIRNIVIQVSADALWERPGE